MSGFFAWLGSAVNAVWTWRTGRETRESDAFKQLLAINERQGARIDNLETVITSLFRKDAEQQQAIEECNEDRQRLAGVVAQLQLQVNDMQTRMLPKGT